MIRSYNSSLDKIAIYNINCVFFLCSRKYSVLASFFLPRILEHFVTITLLCYKTKCSVLSPYNHKISFSVNYNTFENQ